MTPAEGAREIERVVEQHRLTGDHPCLPGGNSWANLIYHLSFQVSRLALQRSNASCGDWGSGFDMSGWRYDAGDDPSFHCPRTRGAL